MPYYAKIVGGIVRGITQTAAPMVRADLVEIDAFQPGLMGYLYAAGEFTAPVVGVTKTQAGFWRLFTVVEREALQNLLATGTQAQKNRLNAFRDYVAAAGSIDLADAYIVSSVQLMRAANIIGPGRDVEILEAT